MTSFPLQRITITWFLKIFKMPTFPFFHFCIRKKDASEPSAISDFGDQKVPAKRLLMICIVYHYGNETGLFWVTLKKSKWRPRFGFELFSPFSRFIVLLVLISSNTYFYYDLRFYVTSQSYQNEHPTFFSEVG